MSWLYLLLAIVLEVCGTLSMKLAQGFTRLLPSIAVFVFYGLSLGFLTLALKKIDVSIAYAVWAGLGTAMISVVGIFWFSEPATAVRIFSIVLIVIGVVGLHMSSGAQ